VGFRNDVERRKFLALLVPELRPLGRPARSQLLYRLSCPGSHCNKITFTKSRSENRMQCDRFSEEGYGLKNCYFANVDDDDDEIKEFFFLCGRWRR
jgi:hypothetical protein